MAVSTFVEGELQRVLLERFVRVDDVLSLASKLQRGLHAYLRTDTLINVVNSLVQQAVAHGLERALVEQLAVDRPDTAELAPLLVELGLRAPTVQHVPEAEARRLADAAIALGLEQPFSAAPLRTDRLLAARVAADYARDPKVWLRESVLAANRMDEPGHPQTLRRWLAWARAAAPTTNVFVQAERALDVAPPREAPPPPRGAPTSEKAPPLSGDQLMNLARVLANAGLASSRHLLLGALRPESQPPAGSGGPVALLLGDLQELNRNPVHVGGYRALSLYLECAELLTQDEQAAGVIRDALVRVRAW